MTQKLHTGKKKGRVSATHLFSLFRLILAFTGSNQKQAEQNYYFDHCPLI
jgi:hypothetical protein